MKKYKESSVYIPMTCNILTPGHIKVLEKLNKNGWVTVGLLTANALKGYKKELQPYEDRFYILETVAMALGNVDIVPQDSLDPTENIKKHGCTALASGDGFEPVEEKAIHKLKLERIDVKLKGETNKQYSSSKICQKIA